MNSWKDLLIKYSLFLKDVEGSMLLGRKGETEIKFTDQERDILTKIDEKKFSELPR